VWMAPGSAARRGRQASAAADARGAEAQRAARPGVGPGASGGLSTSAAQPRRRARGHRGRRRGPAGSGASGGPSGGGTRSGQLVAAARPGKHRRAPGGSRQQATRSRRRASVGWRREGAGGAGRQVLDWCSAGTGAEQGEQERLEAVCRSWCSCRSSHAGARRLDSAEGPAAW
jgi:hypothetical protein